MAIKVGNSWVSEAAYAHAQKNAASSDNEGNMMSQLISKFPDADFTSGTKAFQGTGRINISISPKILREMENNPDKRMEYEALIYDCIEVGKSAPKYTANGAKIVASGFIINSDGSLGGWSVSVSEGKSKKSMFPLPKKDKSSWLTWMKDAHNDSGKTKQKGEDSRKSTWRA